MSNLFLVVKALHVIAMVPWFAGLFYLPRLFVYHADSVDVISIERFKIMEQRLYYGITWPSGIFTTIWGLLLIVFHPYYLKAGWLHVKLGLVILLWGYHLCCGYYLKQFEKDNNARSTRFFRYFNEIPTLFLVLIVILVIIRPF